MKNSIHFLLLILSFTAHAANSKILPKPKFLPGASTRRDVGAPPAAKAPSPSNPDLRPISPPPGMIAPLLETHAPKLNNFNQFNAFASLSEGIIKGAVVKFLIDNRTTPAKINFINGNYLDANDTRPEFVQFHYYFAQKVLGIRLDSETFNNQTYFTNNLQQKKFIAGTLQSYEFNKNGKVGRYLGIQFYPQDAISEQTLAYALKVVREAVLFNDLPMVFVSYGSQQTYAQVQGQLQSLGIKGMTVDDIYSGIPYIPMHAGTTYGHLKLFPKGDALDELSPMDIPVFDELPLDLSVVAGVITTVVQDAGAHVNLKSKERNTPNMVLRDPSKVDALKPLDNKPVKLVVDGETYSVTEVTEAEVKAYHQQKNGSKPWVKVTSGKETAMTLFDEMASKNSVLQLAKKADSYGGKGAKLSLLAHKEITGIGSKLQTEYKYRMTPIGFAIPVQYYFDFLKENPSLKALVDDLIKHEMRLDGAAPFTSLELVKKVDEIQNLFYKSNLPKGMAELLAKKASELKEFAAKTFPNSPIKKVKVRSSANAEDIPQFDGAGLHSSYSAKIEKIDDPSEPCHVVISQDGVATKEEMQPETLVCAVKGVYASLWNKRAIEERNFAHIDQRTAAMGIAVNTSYDFRKKTEKIVEIGNAVLVTRVINSRGVYGYRLSVNTEDNLVTNPTPGTQSEITVASFMGLVEKPTYSIIQHAKTDSAAEVLKGQLLQPQYYDRMVEIARQIEYNYCKNIPDYYPGGDCSWVVSDVDKPSSLDMEFKIFSNGEILVKQVREFSGK